ncbi:MAG: hypothetical protein COB37_06340 [Kordiimonadales bacterium]|nr:MAG: hypothetical protein COB37_06340 [Kordiimonadales bacterium]
MPSETNTSGPIIRVGVAILVILVVGMWLIMRFAGVQADQDMANWQSRLNLIADSRAADVSKWLNRHLLVVETLAADASIQLYATEVALSDDPATSEAQRGYIFSLLSAEAERSGFHEKTAIDTVAANVKRPQRAGLAVVQGDGLAMVMSSGMPLLGAQDWHLPNASSFIALGPQLGDKTPLVLFGARISGADISGDKSSETWVIGARPLDSDFLATLNQPGDDSKTAETYIIIPGTDGVITAVTPLAEGGRIGVARRDDAATFALNNPNGFGQHTNYAGTDVLVTGKELSAPVPWILVRTITTNEALTAINDRRNNLVLMLSFAGIAVLAALVLVWRHGVSRKLEVSYQEKATLSEQKEALYRFVQSVCDGQRTAIAALDEDMTARFVNQKLAAITGIGCAELMNRRLDNAFSGEFADLLRTRVKEAAKGTPGLDRVNLGKGDEERTYQIETIPLNAGGNNSAQSLLVMQDISELVAAQEQSESLFKQLVSALTEIIDARDPWSKHHSARVADVAATLAGELELEESLINSVRVAGQLVNLGKIFVPIDTLTKQSPLTSDELSMVRDSMHKGTQLISGLNFKGPVRETLTQMHERWDGSGTPEGLKGDAIEQGARILAVANAFVGMVSARAHREGLGFDKSADILQSDAGKIFERRTVAALQNILENKGGRDRWAHYMDKPADE